MQTREFCLKHFIIQHHICQKFFGPAFSGTRCIQNLVRRVQIEKLKRPTVWNRILQNLPTFDFGITRGARMYYGACCSEQYIHSIHSISQSNN